MKLSKIDEFLLDREARVKLQKKLLEKNIESTLVTVRVNYPGLEKSNFITDEIHKIISDEINELYKNIIILKQDYKNLEGCICHFLINLDIVKVKNLMIKIEENHILGRCVDIDVYAVSENNIITISRRDLDKTSRKCFLCELDAKICSRNQNHSVDDIKKYFENKYKEYKHYVHKRDNIAYSLSNIALKAIIAEVSTYPSFGLVSPLNNGSHKDMDYYTFLESGFAIVPYLEEMAKCGYSYNSIEDIFNKLRKIGIDAENNMFEVTNGVNTHKGMIFLMGIVIASTSNAIYNKEPFENIENIIKNMVGNILEDFSNLNYKEDLSHGEKLYIEYGFTGIRGQVKNGLDFIFNYVLIEYKKLNLKGNDLYSHTLLLLMSIVQDSTIVYRHNIETLNKVKKDCEKILSEGGMCSKQGKILALNLEKEYIQNNISPGGSADLLSVVIFLGEVYDRLKEI
ncbi:MAG: triphosphoribosyl-dephospho-CoA synthase CitG [Paraclostridium sp.]|uniref:triphosphoribosyl-dephospho-CoA synthase CitG n=1 Tax=Paraclostridium sp. TaxID=2023273 RepID=UPI003F2F9158